MRLAIVGSVFLASIIIAMTTSALAQVIPPSAQPGRVLLANTRAGGALPVSAKTGGQSIQPDQDGKDAGHGLQGYHMNIRGCRFLTDFVAKVPKRRAANFPPEDETSRDRRLI